jgi:hypothetical protein
MSDGSLPAGEVKTKLRATVPLAAAVPDDKARESEPACPREARAVSSEAIAKIDAIRPRVEGLVIGTPYKN